MPRAWKVCSCLGGCGADHVGSCPEIVPPGTSRCEGCKRAADKRRGTAKERGYGSRHARRFRAGVLARDPICTCDLPGRHGHGERCYSASTTADHWPTDRKTLVAQGKDADDPQYGRGMCTACHVTSPGGWAVR